MTPRGQSGGQAEGRPSSESPTKLPKPAPKDELEAAFDQLSYVQQQDVLREMGGVFNPNLFELITVQGRLDSIERGTAQWLDVPTLQKPPNTNYHWYSKGGSLAARNSKIHDEDAAVM